MASYSKWNGEPLHSSRYLLTDVLKGKLGFKVAEPMVIVIYIYIYIYIYSVVMDCDMHKLVVQDF
jgi:hypothetical protein